MPFYNSRSTDFRPCYARLKELRVFCPAGIPVLALTATVTSETRGQIIKSLDMANCKMVSVSPNKPNIYYSVIRRGDTIDEDLSFVTSDLISNSINAKRILIYCQSLDMCSFLYIYFHSVLGDASYHPRGAPQISDNRLFGMFHAKTDDHNKDVILKSLADQKGTVRVVFSTMALDMGVNFSGLTSVIHYGAPRSLDDYFQESGRVGRGGEPSTSVIYWKPKDVPLRKDLTIPRNAEIAVVRRYLENNSDCRRYQLLSYFDPVIANDLGTQPRCCDNCASHEL